MSKDNYIHSVYTIHSLAKYLLNSYCTQVWARYWGYYVKQDNNMGLMNLPCNSNLYAEYIMWNAGLEEAQAGIKIARRNINNLWYADDTTLWQKVKRNQKASWWRWKRRAKKLA